MDNMKVIEKTSRCALGVACVCGLSVIWGAWGAAFPATNPLQFPSYEQQITATFADSTAAQAAACAIAPLPDDAKLTFSCRWDDTIPAHARKSEMMERAGIRGNFYFNFKTDTKVLHDLPPKVLAHGHAIGNHTVSHPHMLQCVPNVAFREIAANRILLECLLNRTVMSYVSPFGWPKNPINSNHERILAEAVVATGHFVTQDNPMPWSGLDARTCMWDHRFSAGDREPSWAEFQAGLAKQLALARADDIVPRIALGTHSWCDAAGEVLQERWLKENFHPADSVSLNDWEYGAYRYQYLHGGVRKLGVRGNSARFAVVRYAPAFVGDAIPLSLKFSQAPSSVRCGNAQLAAGARQTWRLPHDTNRKLPQKIGTQIDGAQLKLTVDERAATMKLRFTNTGKDALTHVYAAVALPPRWAQRRLVAQCPTLAAGASWEQTLSLGEPSRRDYAYGVAYYPVSVDFTRKSEAFRLWQTAETPRVPIPPDAPMSCVRSWGPGAEATLADVNWAQVSQAGAALPDAANWKAVAAKADRLPTVVTDPIKLKGRSGVNEQILALLKSGKHARYLVYDFQSESAGTRVLRSSIRPNQRSPKLWVNGKEQKFTGDRLRFAAQKGANRLILRADAYGEWFTDTVYLDIE